MFYVKIHDKRLQTSNLYAYESPKSFQDLFQSFRGHQIFFRVKNKRLIHSLLRLKSKMWDKLSPAERLTFPFKFSLTMYRHVCISTMVTYLFSGILRAIQVLRAKVNDLLKNKKSAKTTHSICGSKTVLGKSEANLGEVNAFSPLISIKSSRGLVPVRLYTWMSLLALGFGGN